MDDENKCHILSQRFMCTLYVLIAVTIVVERNSNTYQMLLLRPTYVRRTNPPIEAMAFH